MEEIFDVASGSEVRKERRTFYRDSLVPSLPLPSIQQTIEKYLDSCKAILSDEEYTKTEEICQSFMRDEALHLQIPLMQKAIKQRNWLEEWWMDNAYLKVRLPIMHYYFAGPGPYLQHGWPIQEGTQLERSAIVLYTTMQFWFALKTEIFPQHHVGDDTFMTMYQFRYMFNTARIPKRGKDEIHCSFKTAAEGESPTHLIIFFRNRMYKVQGVNQRTGKIHTPPEFYDILKRIVDAAPRHYGESVAALTCLDRDTWADAREHLIDISVVNQKNLRDIENAVICFCLDESHPQSYKDLYRLGMTGPCANRWNDKSFNYAAAANGSFVSTCDHSPYEAMVLVVFVEYSVRLIKLAEKEFLKPWNTDVDGGPIEELIFDLDGKTRSYMRQGLAEYNKFSSNLEVTMTRFGKFGKTALKDLKVHPDGFVQACIQLTYMRMHGHPAPTYETATTRQFYNGRTETLRTCTPEAVAFCKAMIKGSPDAVELFRKAHDKFVRSMNECKQGRGCDRHLMGIALQALENEEPVPALFSDPAFAKTGGGGNFVLSSSFTGYFDGTGGVVPMVENGYGIFYCINNEHMFTTGSAWNGCPDTSAEKFMNELHQSLNDVYNMLNKQIQSNL